MPRTADALGGEQSGHIIFSKYASTGDGMLTSLKLMEVMLARKKPLSKLAEGRDHLSPGAGRTCGCRDKQTAREDPDVQAAVDAVAAELGDTGRDAGPGIRHGAGAAGHGGSAGGRCLPPVRGPRGGR